MKYEEWQAAVPQDIAQDALWTVEAYRLAMFAAEVGWHDVSKLVRDKRTVELADQLYRALGSIGANLSEGYSRGSGRDRARFYEYALGSARESRGWYFHARHVLGDVVAEHRIRLLTQAVRLLLTMVPDQRAATFQEASLAYRTKHEQSPHSSADQNELKAVLQTIPLP